MAKTTIEWTATYNDDGTVIPGFTFNPWVGCQKVSNGCKFCYADTLMTRKTRWANTWGPPETSERIRTSEANWRKPIKWNKEAGERGVRYKVFCSSLADVFEDNPQVDTWRLDLFRLIFDTPNLDWLLLTKRPENVILFMDDACWPESGCPMFGADESLPANVWMGTSVEDQEMAEKRIPDLLKIPVRIKFLSAEPLLGQINLEGLAYGAAGPAWVISRNRPLLDWVIVGGESGPNARPMHPYWVYSLKEQCLKAGIPFFFKQHGEWFPEAPVTANAGFTLRASRWAAIDIDGTVVDYDDFENLNQVSDEAWFMGWLGKRAAGRLLWGREWNDFPLSAVGRLCRGAI